MKALIYLVITFISFKISANDSFILHYLGDAKPITLSLENKSNQSFAESKIHKIVFNFDQSTTLGLNADFNIAKINDSLNIKATSINKSIIEVTQENKPNDTITAKVKFIDSTIIYSPVRTGMTPLKASGKVVSFYSGKLDNEKLFTLHLKIVKKHLLVKDEVIFDKDISYSEYVNEKISETKSLVSIDLNRVTNNSIDDTHAYNVSVTIGLTYPTTNIVNLEQLGPPTISKSIDLRAQVNN